MEANQGGEVGIRSEHARFCVPILNQLMQKLNGVRHHLQVYHEIARCRSVSFDRTSLPSKPSFPKAVHNRIVHLGHEKQRKFNSVVLLSPTPSSHVVSKGRQLKEQKGGRIPLNHGQQTCLENTPVFKREMLSMQCGPNHGLD